MAGANWYKDGTVDVTQGSQIVVGSGTLWTVQAKKGDIFFILVDGGGTKQYEIDSVEDNNHLTLVNPYFEATQSGVQYAIIRNFNTTMTSETNAMLVSFLREWKIALQQQFIGEKGDPGENGNTLLSSNGIPSAPLGTENDWCLDYANWNMYRKEGGNWVLRGNIKGEKGESGIDGSEWFNSPSAPLNSIGVSGDYAINTSSGEIFNRISSGWVSIGNIKGPKGDKGDSIKGDTGDKGDTGLAGSRWYTVSGIPATATGADNDMALDSITGDWYQKSSGAWTKRGNIKGPKGDIGPVGGYGVSWKGTWDVGTTYIERDGVYYNGSSYVALQDQVGQTPPDPMTGGDSFWSVLARKGTDGLGSGDMLKVDYDSNGDGKVNSADLADQAGYAANAGRATVSDLADSVDWVSITSKPLEFPPSSHGLTSHVGSTLAEFNTLITDATIPSNSIATQASDGLMSSSDKTKLDDLATGSVTESDVIALVIALS